MIGLDKPLGLSGLQQVDRPAVRRKAARVTQTEGTKMFQGFIDQDAAAPVEATAIPDLLFERGLYWSNGRSGVVDLVAAHKWFNLAALKGRNDAIALRREIAAQMSDEDIARAQREARAWISAH
jgi:TPR repeat protein